MKGLRRAKSHPALPVASWHRLSPETGARSLASDPGVYNNKGVTTSDKLG
jgi:hypothetical protein